MTVPSPMAGNPLPSMTYLDQAFQFQVEVIGPVGNVTQRSILEPMGFEYHVNWLKEETNGDWLSVKSFVRDGDCYLLIYNQTELSKWRKEWKRSLQPDEPSYKSE